MEPAQEYASACQQRACPYETAHHRRHVPDVVVRRRGRVGLVRYSVWEAIGRIISSWRES